MHRIVQFYFWYFLAVAFINHYCYSDAKEKTEETQGTCPIPVAQVFQKGTGIDKESNFLDSKYTGNPSFPRRSSSQADLEGHESIPIRGLLPLALCVQPPQQEISCALSDVQEALDNWLAQPWKGWESPRSGRQALKPARSKSNRARKGRGKGATGGNETLQPSPFVAPAQIPPWPSPDASFVASNMPSKGQASSASVGNIVSGTAQVPASDLLIAVRKQYPDISKAPPEVREAVEKEEASNSQRIGADLHRTSSQINKATQQLNQLREARRRHREQWLRHLKDSITAWENQMKAFQDQQKQYIDQTNKAKAELSAARRNLQTLNKLAGLQTSVKPEHAESQDLEDGPGDLDATETALTKQVQDCLKQAAAIVNPLDVHDIMDSDEEGEDAPKTKRQRSLEPFGHQASLAPQASGAAEGSM